jgi:hypothetical protein
MVITLYFPSRVHRHVVDHPAGMGVLRVQVGVGVVFGHSPDSVTLIPEGRPPGVAIEEGRYPPGVTVIGKPGNVPSP